MNNKDLLLKEIEELSDDKLREVIDFVRFLKLQGREETLGLMLLSKSSLAETWDNPIDDEVWSDL